MQSLRSIQLPQPLQPLRWFALAACVLSSMTMGGCGESPSGAMLEFEAAWHDAINFREDEKLYTMLDTESQRRLKQDLERLRGLDAAEQNRVLDKLGGERVESMLEITPEAYFKLLWNRITEGRRPLMRIREHDGHTGYMVLSLEDVNQEITLRFEGGQWVWRLPPQTVGFDVPPPLNAVSTAEAAEPSTPASP